MKCLLTVLPFRRHKTRAAAASARSRRVPAAIAMFGSQPQAQPWARPPPAPPPWSQPGHAHTHQSTCALCQAATGEGPKLAGANIFRRRPTSDGSGGEQAKLAAFDAMSTRDAAAAAAAHGALDLDAATEAVMLWILHRGYGRRLEFGSIVGLLTSQHFVGAVAADLDAGLARDFHRFLLSSSLAYSGWVNRSAGQRLSFRDLVKIACAAGCDVLDRLDETLHSEGEPEKSRQARQTLALLVFGTMLGVFYLSRLAVCPTSSYGFPAEAMHPDFLENRSLWATKKEHVFLALADRLVGMGSGLGFGLGKDHEVFLVGVASHGLDGLQTFAWAKPYQPPPPPPPPTATMTTTSGDGSRSLDDESKDVIPGAETALVAIPWPEELTVTMPWSTAHSTPANPQTWPQDSGEGASTSRALFSPTDPDPGPVRGPPSWPPEPAYSWPPEPTLPWPPEPSLSRPPQKRRRVLVVGQHDGVNVCAKFSMRYPDENIGLLAQEARF